MADGMWIDDIKGTKELDTKLQALTGIQADKAIMTALMEGGAILEKGVESTVPVLSGLTKRSIKIRKQPKKPGKYGISIGVGKKDFHGETFYAAFVEWGHHRGKRKAFKSRPWIEGEHWLRNGFEETAPDAIEKTILVLGQQLEKIITKGNV